jgi:aldose 1-epimerase
VSTTVTPTGAVPVPVSFGFHPYLRLPEPDRAAWAGSIPVRERLVLDDRMLPTDAREDVRIPSGPLGDRTFDDAYTAPRTTSRSCWRAADGGSRCASVRGIATRRSSPRRSTTSVAFEPMTAPTNALVTGGPELPLVSPGERFRAVFSVTVTIA